MTRNVLASLAGREKPKTVKDNPAGKMTLVQRRTHVENYLYGVESTLKKG